MKKKVNTYCKLYEEIYERISKICPENASNVALKLFEEILKDLKSEKRLDLKEKAKEESTNGEDLATKKQRRALHRFGVKNIPKELSRKEASELLNKLIELSKAGDKESMNKFINEVNSKWKSQ